MTAQSTYGDVGLFGQPGARPQDGQHSVQPLPGSVIFVLALVGFIEGYDLF